jgi:hypothetical protein
MREQGSKNSKIKLFFHGEFDPGSELTLAVCLSHASRTRKYSSECEYSGGRVSNTWETCPQVGDNPPNGGLIPNVVHASHVARTKGGLSLEATT